ncbi:MAG TPA: hypothetical protein VG711_01150, partial [Phycisphaerales bacterium]|nr:hypothetical protein [Phycisphaerales bacterium]
NPTLIGDRIYQQIPKRGLACYNSVPQDSPGGQKIWFADDVHANIVTSLRDMLIAWNADTRKVNIIDARRGTIVKTIDLPAVAKLWATATKDGDLYASSDDGRIERLVPRK